MPMKNRKSPKMVTGNVVAVLVHIELPCPTCDTGKIVTLSKAEIGENRRIPDTAEAIDPEGSITCDTCRAKELAESKERSKQNRKRAKFLKGNARLVK